MKPAIAKAIATASEVIGLSLDLRTDYSGRSMYGSETHAITGDESDFRKAICYAAAHIEEETTDQEEPITLDDFIEEIGTLRTDNMGRSSLVWY